MAPCRWPWSGSLFPVRTGPAPSCPPAPAAADVTCIEFRPVDGSHHRVQLPACGTEQREGRPGRPGQAGHHRPHPCQPAATPPRALTVCVGVCSLLVRHDAGGGVVHLRREGAGGISLCPAGPGMPHPRGLLSATSLPWCPGWRSISAGRAWGPFARCRARLACQQHAPCTSYKQPQSCRQPEAAQWTAEPSLAPRPGLGAAARLRHSARHGEVCPQPCPWVKLLRALHGRTRPCPPAAQQGRGERFVPMEHRSWAGWMLVAPCKLPAVPSTSPNTRDAWARGASSAPFATELSSQDQSSPNPNPDLA